MTDSTRSAPRSPGTKAAQRPGVIGAGAWGTALASVLARAGSEVLLWAREPDVRKEINQDRRNSRFLPNMSLPEGITAIADLAALESSPVIFLVTPAQHMRASLIALAPHVAPGTPLVVCAKGIEQSTGLMLSKLVQSLAPKAVPAVLSGPSFAAEVAHNLPTALTLACTDIDRRGRIADLLDVSTFRLYASDDLVGAQIGGAVKNVLAIACGISDGLALGENARAALITRGFAEMCRLGLAQGAKMDTLSGLAGLGDLILTCGSAQSRNMSLGQELGRGRPLSAILDERQSVAEGVHTASVLVAMARKISIEMPISAAVHSILTSGVSVNQAMADLLARPPRAEGVHA